jgi:hypothetical protein
MAAWLFCFSGIACSGSPFPALLLIPAFPAIKSGLDLLPFSPDYRWPVQALPAAAVDDLQSVIGVYRDLAYGLAKQG